MKSKSIFILVLFSLLLNIFHDSFIEQYVQKKISVMATQDKLENTLCDLHELFHFTAILPLPKSSEISVRVSTKPSFTKKIYVQNILETSFKPPRT